MLTLLDRNDCQLSEVDQIAKFYINYWTATYQFCLLEPRAGKLARVVLRGERTSNSPDLPDKVSRCVPRGERINNDPDLPDKK